MGKVSQASKQEVKDRIEYVAELLLSYHKVREIQQIITKKYPNVSVGAINYYITKAREEIAKVNPSTILQKRNKAIKTLENLFNQAYKQKKWTSCLNIQREIGILQQLYQPIAEDKPTENISIKLVKQEDNG